MSTESFSIPKGFQKVILVIAGMNLQAWYAGFKVGKIRRQIFNQEFMDKNFGDVHKREIGQPIQRGGYPDTGSGLYSQKLSYSDWYKFNVQQRIHLNYVEQLGLATTSVLAGGLVCPHIGIGIGLTHIIARLLYGFFYERKGAANKIRMISAALGYIANLVGLGFFLRHFFFK